MSGHKLPVPNTPIAAKITATFPIASFRLQSQTDCILESPSLKAYKMTAQTTFASKAITPITPMVIASGGIPKA
ncbi:hypothetical protein D3C71_1729820 [compost metagenome]